MGLNEAQEAEIVEARLTALGDGADRYDILHAIAGFSEQAVAIALRRLGGGGPGGGALTQTAVTLDHDDILALSGGTAFQLVAAPTAGKLILPVTVVLVCDTTAGAYTTIDTDAVIQAGLDDDFSAYPITTPLSEGQGSGAVTNLLAASAKSIGLMGVSAIVPASAAPTTLLGWNLAQDPTAYDGQPLSLTMENGGSPVDSGNAANTLTVTTIYATIDL